MQEKKTTTTLFKMLSSSNRIDTYLEKYEKELEPVDFIQYLNQLAGEKEYSISEIIIQGSFNESYCYQIFKGTRKPSRDKIIQLCFAMGLNLYEANKLLRAGGKAELYCRDKRDAVIIFGLNNKLSIIGVEEVMLDNGFDSITGLSD